MRPWHRECDRRSRCEVSLGGEGARPFITYPPSLTLLPLHLLEASLYPSAGARPFVPGHMRVAIPHALAIRDGCGIRFLLTGFDRPCCCGGVCGGGLRQRRSRAESKQQKHAHCGQIRRWKLLEVERCHRVSLLHSGTGGSGLWALSAGGA